MKANNFPPNSFMFVSVCLLLLEFLNGFLIHSRDNWILVIGSGEVIYLDKCIGVIWAGNWKWNWFSTKLWKPTYIINTWIRWMVYTCTTLGSVNLDQEVLMIYAVNPMISFSFMIRIISPDFSSSVTKSINV